MQQAKTAGDTGCCGSEKEPEHQDAPVCDCLGCVDEQVAAEVTSTAPDVPDIRLSLATSPLFISPLAPKTTQLPRVAMTARLTGPPVYLLFEVLRT